MALQIAPVLLNAQKPSIKSPADKTARTANIGLTTDNKIVQIRHIDIKGYKRTKPYIILRELTIKEGEQIDTATLSKKITESRDLIFNTSLFLEVAVTPSYNGDGHADVNVVVKERWYTFPIPYFKVEARNFNDWWVTHNHSFDRVDYGLKFLQANLTGRNDNIYFWLINGYNQQISSRYSLPFFEKSLKHGISFDFIYSKQKQLNYATDSNKQVFLKDVNAVWEYKHGEVFYSYRPNQYWRHSLMLGYSSESVPDTVLRLNPTFYPLGKTSFSYPEISWTTRYLDLDYFYYPTHGFSLGATLYKRGIDNPASLWQLTTKFVWANHIGHNSFVRLEGLGTYKIQQYQPYNTNHLLGFGDFQLHGYEYYIVDGTAGGVLRYTMGKKIGGFMLKNPIRGIRHERIPLTFYFTSFADAGYCYNNNSGNSFLNNKLLFGYGIGIDLVSFYDFVFKLDFSINQLGDKGFYFNTQNSY